jgi:histone H3/H4
VGRRPRRKMEKWMETKQMKLTKQTLKRIIKEELEKAMSEGFGMSASGHMDEKIKNWAANLIDARSVDILFDVIQGYMRMANISPTDSEDKHTPEIMKRIPQSISREYDQQKISQVVGGMVQGFLEIYRPKA